MNELQQPSASSHNHEDLPGSLSELLDRLKRQGWPPSDRAIVYFEWRALVRTALVAPPPHDGDRFVDGISDRARQELLGLVHVKVEDFQRKPINYLKAFGWTSKNVSMEQKIAMMQQLRGHSITSALEGDRAVNWIDFLSYTSIPMPFHHEVRSMDMDEEDLEAVLHADRLSMDNLPNVEQDLGVSLEEARERVAAAFARSGLHRLELPALDAEDPDRLMALAACLTTLNDTFERAGGKRFTLGTPNSVLFLGLIDNSCSGYCSGQDFMATAAHAGHPLVEVIAHEALHMHDFAFLSNNRVTASDELLNPRSEYAKDLNSTLGDEKPLLKPLARLMGKLRQLETDISPEERQRHWEMAEQGLPDRWASMGLPSAPLRQAYETWKVGALNDKAFVDQMTQWFEQAGRGETSRFRAGVVLSECLLIRRANTETPVWQQATDEFSSILPGANIGVNPDEYGGKNYFSCPSEILARSFQLLFSDDHFSNPFAKRWLVYLDQAQSSDVAAAWQEFLHDPAVAEKLPEIAHPQPSDVLARGNFKTALQAYRKTTSDCAAENCLDVSRSKPAL